MSKKWKNLFPNATRNKADFLIDGEDAFGSIIQAIETANAKGHYIYILGWMLDIDFQLLKNSTSKTLFNLLKKASDNDVEIRILIWDNLIPAYYMKNNEAKKKLSKLKNTEIFIDPNLYFPKASKQVIQTIAPFIKKLIKKYGPKILSPSARFEENHDVPPSYIIFRLLNLLATKSIGSHHEKIVIVKGRDGLKSILGGIDFNENRVKTKVDAKMLRFPRYHDTACRIEGPAAYDVLQKFILRWNGNQQAKKIKLIGAKEKKPKEAGSIHPYAKIVGTYNSADGSKKDRSLRDAYFTVIDNANYYIYIEDQYLVNLDVAKKLNRKIKGKDFELLLIVIQDAEETADIFIPNRKRTEFMLAVYDGATKEQRGKVVITISDKTSWKRDHFHPGVHAKTLIADDQIAIIGSANVNQRSFTVDSETSVVIFDEHTSLSANFAYKFRSALFKHYFKIPPKNSGYYENWMVFRVLPKYGPKRPVSIAEYTSEKKQDLDESIIRKIKSSGAVGAAIIFEATGKDLQLTSVLLSPPTIRLLFDELWTYLVDPKAD